MASSEEIKKAPKVKQPTICDRVCDAIRALKERKGSSTQAIKKYIAANYEGDADRLAPHIRKFLKTAVEANILIRTKGIGASGSFRIFPVAKKVPSENPEEKKSSKKSPAKKAKKPSRPAKKSVEKMKAKQVTEKSAKKPAVKKVAAKSETKKATKSTAEKKVTPIKAKPSPKVKATRSKIVKKSPVKKLTKAKGKK